MLILVPFAAFGMTRAFWPDSSSSEGRTSEVARTTPSEAQQVADFDAKLSYLEGKKFSTAKPILDRVVGSYEVFDARDDDFPVGLFDDEIGHGWVVCWIDAQSDDSTGSNWLAVSVAPRGHCLDTIQD